MAEERKENGKNAEQEVKQEEKKQLSPTWATECIEDIDDWIESQGIYLRQ